MVERPFVYGLYNMICRFWTFVCNQLYAVMTVMREFLFSRLVLGFSCPFCTTTTTDM